METTKHKQRKGRKSGIKARVRTEKLIQTIRVAETKRPDIVEVVGPNGNRVRVCTKESLDGVLWLLSLGGNLA